MSAVLHPVGSQHQGSHPLDVSRVMIPLTKIPGSRIPDLSHSTSPRAAELVVCMCVPARMGTAYAYAVLHVPCIWGNARPHAPHLRSSVQVSGSPVWGNPRIHGSRDLLLGTSHSLWGWGYALSGCCFILTSGPLVLRSNPRASSCSGSLWDHRPMAIPFWDIPVMLRSSIRMYPRSSPRVISRCPDEDML